MAYFKGKYSGTGIVLGVSIGTFVPLIIWDIEGQSAAFLCMGFALVGAFLGQFIGGRIDKDVDDAANKNDPEVF